MADFKEGDWVAITPTPDKKWHEWKDDTQTLFCGRLGYIQEVLEDTKFPGNIDEYYLKVSVYFGDWTDSNGPNWYWAFFKKRHVIKAPKATGLQYVYDEEASLETDKYEKCVKKKRDDIFKHIFGIKEPKRTTSWSDTDEENALSWMTDL